MFSFGFSTFYYLHIHIFLYRSPSSSSCSVVEAVSFNIDKALILQPSANIMVCGDFNAHTTKWLCHSCTTDAAGMFCQEFAIADTQIVDFPAHQPYLLDLFLCSNPDPCTVASHPPLGKSDHMVVSVDVKFVVTSTNVHPDYHTSYSYSKVDWDGLRDYIRDVLWLDIFKHYYHYDLEAFKDAGHDRIPAIVLKMCSPELSLAFSGYTKSALLKFSFPSCWLCQFLKMMERDLIQVSIVL